MRPCSVNYHSNVQAAIQTFYSRFAERVYLETLVPDNAPYPYKIEKAVPIFVGTAIQVSGEKVYQWHNPATNAWEDFDIGYIKETATEFYMRYPDTY